MEGEHMSLSSTLTPSTDGHRAELIKSNDHPEILPSEIELGEKLGEGSFSEVYKGKCRGQDVAVKIFNVQNDVEELENIRKEIQVMSQIFHPNVVLFMGACTDPDEQLMIVTERLPSDMHSLLIENKRKYPLSLRKRMKMAKQAALGVNWLHSGKKKFIHRDLKLSNLLVTHDFNVRVADFGLATLIRKDKGESEQPQGSPAYMAPEVFMGTYDEKCDVYSFGMVLWEMLTQERVFQDLPNLQQLMYAVIEEHKRPEIPSNCPTSLRQLISACWAHESTDRPTFQEIIDALDHVLVDVGVQDHDARDMWKKNFWGKNRVPWEDFATTVCKTLRMDPPDFSRLSVELACLRELMAAFPKKVRIKGNRGPSDSAMQVKLSTFGNMVQCFGPFDKTFVRRIRKILASKWFWGALSQAEAEAALAKHKTTGTFLIRFSSSPGFFTLSFIGKAQIEHHRIIHMPGKGCLVWGKKPKDLFAVVDLGKEKKLLKKHCSGSPYSHLFDKKKKEKAPVQSGYHLPSEADLKAMYGSGGGGRH